MALPVPRWRMEDWLTQQHLWHENRCLLAETNKDAPRALQEWESTTPWSSPSSYHQDCYWRVTQNQTWENPHHEVYHWALPTLAAAVFCRNLEIHPICSYLKEKKKNSKNPINTDIMPRDKSTVSLLAGRMNKIYCRREKENLFFS